MSAAEPIDEKTMIKERTCDDKTKKHTLEEVWHLTVFQTHP
jgi:hypothetical protein